MSIKKIQLKLIFFILILVFPSVNALETVRDQKKRAILCINSYKSGVHWSESFHAGLHSILKKHKNLEVIYDYLETSIKSRKKFSKEFYRKRYGNEIINLIIVSDNQSFKFAQILRDSIFPAIPIIYSSNDVNSPGSVSTEKNIYEVRDCNCIARTIELAIKLQPEAKEIFFICDKTPVSNLMLSKVEKMRSSYVNKLEFHTMNNLSMHTIPLRMAQVPPDSIVMYLNLTEDQHGNKITSENSIKLIARNLKAPLYCTHGFTPGSGAVGGVITDGFQHGRITAELAKKLLFSKKRQDIHKITIFTSPMKIDYQALVNHGLSAETLPPSCHVVNRPKTIKELYRLYRVAFNIIIGIIVAFLVTSFILPYYIRKTKKISASKKQISLALKQSNANFELIFRNAPVGIARISVNNNMIVDVNKALCEIFGCTFEDLINVKFTDFFHPEQVPGDTDYLKMIITGKLKEYTLEKTCKNKSGQKRWIKMTISPMWKPGERPSALIAIFQDDSDVWEKEDKLENYKEELEKRVESRTQALDIANFELQTILNSVRAAIFYKDTKGKYIKVNRAAANMTGMPIHEIEGKSGKVLFPAYQRIFAKNDNEVIRTGKPKVGIEEKLTLPNGRMGWILSDIYPTYDNGGNISGVIVLCFDISKEKESERKLEERYEEMVVLNKAMLNLVDDLDIANREILKSQKQLELANEELRSFSYSVSHDLRAPLRALDGFSEIILQDYKEKLDDDGRDALLRIRRASTNMGELIDSLLRLSRISQSPLTPQEVNLSESAEKICKKLSDQDQKRKVKFSVTPDIYAVCDEELIIIVLTNLLGNAWKFTRHTEDAEIEFGCEKDEKGNDIYFVKDNGAGFDMKYADKLFGAFQRLHSKGEFEGDGIGLATVKRVIGRHNGTVRAKSEVNKGTTFYFTLNENPLTKGGYDGS